MSLYRNSSIKKLTILWIYIDLSFLQGSNIMYKFHIRKILHYHLFNRMYWNKVNMHLFAWGVVHFSISNLKKRCSNLHGWVVPEKELVQINKYRKICTCLKINVLFKKWRKGKKCCLVAFKEYRCRMSHLHIFKLWRNEEFCEISQWYYKMYPLICYYVRIWKNMKVVGILTSLRENGPYLIICLDMHGGGGYFLVDISNMSRFFSSVHKCSLFQTKYSCMVK